MSKDWKFDPEGGGVRPADDGDNRQSGSGALFAGTTIAFDALHTRGETHVAVVDYNKADYFCIVEKNTKTVPEKVESLVGSRVEDTAETFDIGCGRADHPNERTGAGR